MAGSSWIDPCERTCITRQSSAFAPTLPCYACHTCVVRHGLAGSAPLSSYACPARRDPSPGRPYPPQAPAVKTPGRRCTAPGDHCTHAQVPPLKPPGAAAPPRGKPAPPSGAAVKTPRTPLHRPGETCTHPQVPPLKPPGAAAPPRGKPAPPQVPAVIRPAFKPGQRTAIHRRRARMPGGTDPWTSSAARPKKISVRPRAPRRGTARRTTATGRRHRAPSPPPRRSRSCGPRRRSTRGACTPPRTARRR